MNNGEHRTRTIALAVVGLCLSVGGGAGLAHWAMAETNGFYTDPVQRAARSPGYLRDRAVADDFWATQGQPQPVRYSLPQPAAVATTTPFD
ncbi:hypothetical protein M9980_06465 [Sphingomonas donggukensis]|uniref:Uncharacterized protein n=1 Tax=Sphingomonas donggukensis TaxID=2949093 RepID=A0ABY4TWR4_9SPHN|nr:hypothetical protein [Sphingomonas donggukensis]URW76832.1 hypothetical protein M9980_06465 [Sphingomonas donggukensis]